MRRLILWLLFLLLLKFSNSKKRNVKLSETVDSDLASSNRQRQNPTPSTKPIKSPHKQKVSEPTDTIGVGGGMSSKAKHDEITIEDVDEDKIDDILQDATKNLVIFFYDGRAKCSECGDALAEIEKIDDDIEATGYVEVVKTDDRSVARELGVATFPSMVYFRRKNPIAYDGDFKSSESILRWLRSHDELVTWDLTDDNFESKTNSYSPDEGALDWFVMFYKADYADCNAFVPSWETVAHKLRGLVNAGKVDISVNDDVTERFRLDDDQCPVYLLFHRSKIYRYKNAAMDIKSLTAFAMSKFKEQRGHRVPEPPTALEHFYEHVKERIFHLLEDSQALSIIGVGGLIAIVLVTMIISKKQQQNTVKTKAS